jgi:site-specific recombinase XerC
VPDNVSQRYSKAAACLGIDTHLHNLRHYSATELIAAGVDIRTVARRLGHGGGVRPPFASTQRSCPNQTNERHKPCSPG